MTAGYPRRRAPRRERFIGMGLSSWRPGSGCPRSTRNPVFVADGGLIGYGPDRVDQYRRAADYVDCILKGEKPADLPVQAPTNLKTASANAETRGKVMVAVHARVPMVTPEEQPAS